MDAMTSETKKTRRRYGAQFKAMVLAQCEEPGVSVAQVAMSHGINDNVVHRWRQLAREGKTTLPLIHAMKHGSDSQQKMIRHAIEDGESADLHEIQAIIEATGSLQYTAARAQEAADLAVDALSGIPDSDWKDALIAIAEFAVNRRS